MFVMFDFGVHNTSPNPAQAADAVSSVRGVRTMIPESANGLWGPRRKWQSAMILR